MATPVSQGGIDYPDGGFSSGSGVFPMSGDLGELAARLESVVTHNREGSIVYIETFEYGVNTWHPTLYGTGSEIYISAARSRSRGYSCKMIAGSDGSAAAKIFRSFPLPTLSRYGLEFSWLPEANTDILEWRLSYHDGTDVHHYIARYRTTEDDVQIKDEDGNWLTVVTSLDLTYTYADFHTIKTVGDLADDQWERLIINGVEYDLTDYAAYVTAEVAGPDVLPAILIWGNAGANGFSYIDDVILTQNEPAH